MCCFFLSCRSFYCCVCIYNFLLLLKFRWSKMPNNTSETTTTQKFYEVAWHRKTWKIVLLLVSSIMIFASDAYLFKSIEMIHITFCFAVRLSFLFVHFEWIEMKRIERCDAHTVFMPFHFHAKVYLSFVWVCDFKRKFPLKGNPIRRVLFVSIFRKNKDRIANELSIKQRVNASLKVVNTK